MTERKPRLTNREKLGQFFAEDREHKNQIVRILGHLADDLDISITEVYPRRNANLNFESERLSMLKGEFRQSGTVSLYGRRSLTMRIDDCVGTEGLDDVTVDMLFKEHVRYLQNVLPFLGHHSPVTLPSAFSYKSERAKEAENEREYRLMELEKEGKKGLILQQAEEMGLRPFFEVGSDSYIFVEKDHTPGNLPEKFFAVDEDGKFKEHPLSFPISDVEDLVKFIKSLAFLYQSATPIWKSTNPAWPDDTLDDFVEFLEGWKQTNEGER